MASFYPLAYAAAALEGNRADVENLTPLGAEPHDIEISPADVGDLQSADLVLLLGRGFQPQLESAAGDGSHVARLLDTPGLGVSAANDPHVWLDPLRYARIARRIGILTGRPAGSLVARLRRLDREFRSGLADCRRRDIVTSHEAFGYLARRYGLRQIAVTGLNPEAEPSPQTLQNVVEAVRETHATTVFSETLVSPRVAETVARETNAQVATLNPIEGLTAEQERAGDDYFSLMRANLTALREALGCR